MTRTIFFNDDDELAEVFNAGGRSETRSKEQVNRVVTMKLKFYDSLKYLQVQCFIY